MQWMTSLRLSRIRKEKKHKFPNFKVASSCRAASTYLHDHGRPSFTPPCEGAQKSI